MQLAIISDNEAFVDNITRILEIYKIGEIGEIYRTAEEAVSKCTQGNICFFADITADTGFDYINRLRGIINGAAVVFYAENGEQCFGAMDNGADYCITAPLTVNKVIHGVEIAENLLKASHKQINICTFGSFEVYVNGNILNFKNAKAKELLALCVDMKGEKVLIEKAVSVLWEDRLYDENTKKLYRKAVIYLRNLFDSCGAEDIFETGRGFCRINREAVYCDYYAYLDNNGKSIYQGEYMSRYSWAEETAARLHFMQSEKNKSLPLEILW